MGAILLFLLLTGFLLALEAFFSGTEAAVLSSDKVTVRHLAQSGNRAAIRLCKMLKAPERLVATTLLGTNICVVSNSVLLTILLERHVGPAAPAAVTAILAPLVFIFGELLPKVCFQLRANRCALLFSLPLRVAQVLFSPLIGGLDLFARWMLGDLRKHRSRGASDMMVFSREQLLAGSQMALASLTKLGSRAIVRVIEFSEKPVGDIMVDISQVASVPADTAASRAMSLALRKGFSRLLVHSGPLSNLVGFVHISSLLAASSGTNVEQCMSGLLYVAEAQRCGNVLKLMQKRRAQIAAVVNEYGACVGIVTLEDLIEEIFGEIRDEFDRPPGVARHLDEGYIDVDAYIGISELRSLANVSLPYGRYETLAGFLIERFGAVPPTGTRIVYGGMTFVVTDADQRRIRRVRIVLPTRRVADAQSNKG